MWKIHVLLNNLKIFLVRISIESFLDSWIFNLIILDSWFLKLESWNLILESWNQISLDSWSVLDSILNSFSWAFCHHLCYHQNSLNQSWFIIMKLASTISPFLMMTTLKSRNTYTHFFLVDHSLNFPFSPFVFEFMLHLKLS